LIPQVQSSAKGAAAPPVVMRTSMLGSSCIGLVVPGTTEKSVWKVSHPALFDEKSGGAFCCAAAPVVSEAKAKPVKMPPASNFAVEANADIFPP
jgi:hypothetical protein